MKTEAILLLGGVFNAGFAIFHLFFWRLFRWKEQLPRLNFVNRGIMQVMNLCLAFLFAAFAFLLFFYGGDVLATALGRALLAVVALFWLLRALEQVIFFTLKRPLSQAFFAAFLGGAALHAYPLL